MCRYFASINTITYDTSLRFTRNSVLVLSSLCVSAKRALLQVPDIAIDLFRRSLAPRANLFEFRTLGYVKQRI